jgi:diguanylate cyclase (GGDEF)-like protein
MLVAGVFSIGSLLLAGAVVVLARRAVLAAHRDRRAAVQALEQLTLRADRDHLTGLPNRAALDECLAGAIARARRSGRALAVVFVDLDDFKRVNDLRGHDCGDRMLAALAPRLLEAVRDGDTVARLGGDEFVALCEDVGTEAGAIEIAQRLVAAVRRPIVLDDQPTVISCSAGIALASRPGELDPAGLLADADDAMYQAKSGGKGRVVVCDEGLRERMRERTRIERALGEALSGGELRLYYQPVIALGCGRVASCEALLRWQHPHRGLLAPDEFLPAAQRAGMLSSIGEWAIEQACSQAVIWRELFPSDPVAVSVNVSDAQTQHAGLAGSVGRVLARTGLEQGLLALEISESALLLEDENSRRELLACKALGVGLIVDDYGIGYSSLARLRELMVDGLKLDRSFLSGLESGTDALLGAVIGLADAINAAVTAAGVETHEQARSLRAHGCDYAQGYLFARPAPADELTELIAASRVLCEPAATIRHGCSVSPVSASVQRSVNDTDLAGLPSRTRVVSRSSM